jgi:TatD DNase family protein
MIRDIHTHHHPSTPGEAIVQLMSDAFYPQQGHFYSVGLHPWEIKDDWRTQMAGLLVKALHPQVAMIGEAGIDKKNGAAPLEVQMEVFREHVRLSELLRKPLIIHCVKGFDEVLAIRKEMKAALPWLIHGFRGGIEQWQQLSRAGLLVSIGEHYDEELVKELPLSQLFIESDERGDLLTIYNFVSETKHVEASELAQHVAANIYSLLTACRPQ